MKVLMFGWEFPPKIYGGLAVASYGILSSAWIAAMSNGQQPSAPEDYIEVEK